ALAPKRHMDIYKKIQKARGSCIAGIKESKVRSVEAAAELFGLSNESGIYEEIGRAEAIEVLRNVLHKDMAYSVKIMSPEKAKNLAAEFVCNFGDEAKFYTNGEYGKPRKNPNVGPSWSPATEATFDTGVIVINKEVVGCAWFADED
ncbi:hypothetical protein KUV59_17720, partial [Marinobacter daepoensis]|uniref:hypothetical protein n=1 Tax=Marinobacter daepoensis TaxID=262077 RepID=UPI001C982406